VGAVMTLTLGQPPRRPEAPESEEPGPEIVPDTV